MNRSAPILRYPLSWRSWRFRLVAAMVLAVLVLRLIWGPMLHARLDARLATLRARGEPARLDDVKFAAVAEGQNAWMTQLAAAQAAVKGVDSPRTSNLEYIGYPPFEKAWMVLAEGSESAHAQVFALARKARSMPQVQVREKMDSDWQKAFMPLGGIRHLSNIVSDGSLLMHTRGNDVEALDRALDVLHVARSLRHDCFIVSQLVASGVDALACSTIQTEAPGLKLAAGSPERERARAVIAALLDEELLWDGLRRSLLAERVTPVDYYLNQNSHGVWFIKPLTTREAVAVIDTQTVALEAAAKRDMPSARALLRTIAFDDSDHRDLVLLMDLRKGSIPRYSRWFNDGNFSQERYFITQHRTLMERRLTAVNLAMQMYRADHAKFPRDINELVPTYLAEIPHDSFRGGGARIGLVIKKGARPDGQDRPMIYYVEGPNDKEAPWDEPMYDYVMIRNPDIRKLGIGPQYRDLTRFAPKNPPPSAKTVDDDPGKPDDPGDKPEKENDAEQPKK